MNNLNYLGKNDSRLAVDRKQLPARSPSRQSWCTCDEGDDHHHAFRQDKARLAEMDLEAQHGMTKPEGGMGPGLAPPGGPPGRQPSKKGPKDPNVVRVDPSP